MNILIAAVGRMKSGPEQTLVDMYRQRLPWALDVREIEPRQKSPSKTAIVQISDALMDLVPQGSQVVCLDSSGRDLTSEKLADQIRVWRDDAVPTLAFLIGGPDGLSSNVLKQANLTLSFGKVTWPHMLARVMLLEQLYRAHCILTDHPYHRGH